MSDDDVEVASGVNKDALITTKQIEGMGGFQNTTYRVFCPQKVLTNKRTTAKANRQNLVGNAQNMQGTRSEGLG